jgi:L-histidine Nalpha-methyltransferase
MKSPRFLQLHQDDDAAVRAELLRGLQSHPATVAPKFLYDALGSRLFDAITELPEYYPTRTERAIVDRHLPELAAAVGRGSILVDLGSGNGEKAARLFEALAPRAYVAVDISVEYLRESLRSLQRRFPALEILGIGMDFSARLQLPADVGPGPRCLHYPGSSIGNFTPEAALDFLRQAQAECRGGGLVIGVDLVKDRATLERAYDDPLQVTAAFNRNLVRRLKAVLGGDAQVEDWRHVAFFDPVNSRIEMHLEAVAPVTLTWPGGSRRFERGERIHTENSYKYSVASFTGLLRDAGFGRVRCWTDEAGWFAVFHAAA